MLDFKKKLRQEVVDPAQEINRVHTFKATAVNPKNKEGGNKCKVEFTNEDGKDQTIKAEILIHGNDQNGGWYPKNGESVYVQKINDKYTIIGRATDDYDEFKEKNKIQTDVFSDMITGIMPSILY